MRLVSLLLCDAKPIAVDGGKVAFLVLISDLCGQIDERDYHADRAGDFPDRAYCIPVHRNPPSRLTSGRPAGYSAI